MADRSAVLSAALEAPMERWIAMWRDRSPDGPDCYMKWDIIAVIMLTVGGFLAIAQSHAQTHIDPLFSNLVKAERIRVCAESPIPTCDCDFDIPARFAAWLDAQEERATTLEKSGEKQNALKVRRQILAYAVMLDIWLDRLIVLHRNK
jgi:hypothetical protein